MSSPAQARLLPEQAWKGASGGPYLALCPHQDGSPLRGRGCSWTWDGSQEPSGGARPSALPHTAGALQVGWPQTPVPWVGAPRPLGGHSLRLADLSGPRPEAQKLTHLRTTQPPPFLPATLTAVNKAKTTTRPRWCCRLFSLRLYPLLWGTSVAGSTGPPALGQCPSPVQAATLVWGPKGTPAPTNMILGLDSRRPTSPSPGHAGTREASREPAAATRCARGGYRKAQCQPAGADATVTGAQMCPSSEVQLVGPEQPSQRNNSHQHPRLAGVWQHTSPEKLGHAGLGARNQNVHVASVPCGDGMG